MPVSHDDVLLRIEHARMAWEYALKEAEMHQQRLVQLFAVFLAAGLALVGSVVLEKVAPGPGLLLAAFFFAGAVYAHPEGRRLPTRLREALRTGQGTLQSLMTPGDQS